VDGSTKSEGFLELREVVNTDDGMLREESFEDVVIIEDLDGKEEFLLDSGDVESGNQKLLVNKLAQNFIDDLYTSGLAAAEARVNATIVGSRNLETVLAGEYLASSVIAGDLIYIGDVLAVLATGGTTERRSDGTSATYNQTLSITVRTAKKKTLTALRIARNIGTLVTASIVGDTAHGFPSRAGRVIAPPLGGILRIGGVLRVGGILRVGRILRVGGILRATSAWEAPTLPITLAVWCLAYTLGGVCRRERRVTILTCKAARTVDAAGRRGMRRIVAFLLILLALDL